MNMTEGEICRQYRSAKDRASQLQILADLNCVPRLEIIKILMHNGEQVRLPLAVKGKKRTTELTDEELAKFLPTASNFICQPTEECIKNTMTQRGECEKTEECAMKWLCAESEE